MKHSSIIGKAELFLLALLMLPLSFLQAEKAEKADGEQTFSMSKIERIAEEAGQIARVWAEEFTGWQDRGDRSSAFMGVVIDSVPGVLRDYINLPDGVGILVKHVTPGGPAEKAGIKENDILLRFNDQLLVNLKQLSTLIDLAGAGEEVTLEVIRKGEKKTFSLRLEERSGGGGEAPQPPEPPEVPEAPANGDEVGAIMKSVEKWIPGSVRVYVDDNEQVTVDLQDLKEDLQDLRLKLQRMRDAPAAPGVIVREHGDLGTRKTVVHLSDQNLNYTDPKGKLILTSSEAGRRVMIWDRDGHLLFDGSYPPSKKEDLPEIAQGLLERFRQSRQHLLGEGIQEEDLEFELKEQDVDPLTMEGGL
jgi:hypothetical protein